MAEEVQVTLKGKFENGKLLIDQTEQIDKNIDSMGTSAKATDKNTSSLLSTLKKIAAVVGIVFLANQFKNLVKGSLLAAGTLEQVDIALTTMIGSAEKAAKLQKDLIEFAKKTPFQIEGIFTTTKQLLAYGVAQEDIIDTMSTLGNIAAGVSVPIERLALVFGQVRSTGRLLGQDLNQFTQAGVPLLAELAKVLDVTEGEVLKLKEAGKISFDLVKVALEGMTSEGGRFFNLMENQSKTFLGTISNMGDSFFQVKAALGEALLPIAKDVVNFMVISFEKLLKIIENNSAAITSFARGVFNGFAAIGTVFGFFFDIITSILGALGIVTKSIEDFPDSVKIMMLTSTKWFNQLKFVIFDFVESALDHLSLLSGIPMFGWIDRAKKDFADLKDALVKDINTIDAAIKEIRADSASVVPLVATAGNFPQIKDQQSTISLIQEDPEKLEKKRLKALKDENKELLEAQKDFLAGFITNQSEADQILDENSILKLQQKLLHEGEFAERKGELDQQLLDNKITTDEFERELEQINNEAKLEALQLQFDAEFAKEEANTDRLIQLKVQLEKARKLESEKRNKIEKILDSDNFIAAGKAAGELVALQNSKHKELAAIGQAAAVFQITVDTARGAISAYSSLAPIPIVGPALGAAAAAAVIAFGGEQLANATTAAFALGTPNILKDQLAQVHKGEMIIPATFSEAIRAGELSLTGQVDSNNQQGTGSGASVNIIFENSQFFGEFNDEVVAGLAQQMGELIQEDIIPPIPTRTA